MSKKIEAIVSLVLIILMLLSTFLDLGDADIYLIITIIVGCLSLVISDVVKEESNGHYITWTLNGCMWVAILLLELKIINF